jgi:hypothetical protein
MKKIIILVLLSFGLYSEDFPKTNTRYVLIQSGVLNLREKPVDGKVIAKLNAGDTVTVIEDAKDNYGWKKIKTTANQTGFASDEFLGYFPPAEIQKGKLIGVLGSGDSGQNITKGAPKKNISVLENAKLVGSFKPESIAKYGCQEFKGIAGTSTPKELTSSNEKLYLGTVGISPANTEYTVTEKVSAELISNLQKEAVLVFKKNKVSPKEIENISDKKIVQVTAVKGKSYLIGRFAIRKEHAEKHYVSLVAEIIKNDGFKIIHSKFESLGEERGNYGGSFHFMGVIDLDNSGVPALLFHHIGFDSGIYELFRIVNDKIESVFLGGGDAC